MSEDQAIVYPLTRHIQRYEFLLECPGLIDDKNVLDIGCGNGYGSLMLTIKAREVIGIDPDVFKNMPGDTANYHTWRGSSASRLQLYDVDIYKLKSIKSNGCDIAIAMEVIEHVADPDRFLQTMAKAAPLAVLSTPMVEKTGKTRNPDHVQEFSNDDFMALISRYFDIKCMLYQTATCNISLERPVPQGDSFSREHIVQMAICRPKGGVQ